MEPFRHAVASFEPTSSGVLLWTRLTAAVEAEWVIARDPELVDVVASGRARTGPERDHTVAVDVDGLAAATTYWYRFSCGGEHSPVGRTRTLPDAPTARLRLGLACCAHYSVAPLGVYRALAEREVDLVVHLGDYIYEDDGSQGVRTHRPPRPAVSLEDYRDRLAQLREDPDLQALHLRHPMTGIWDDHDLADNAWRGGAKKHDPETAGAWSTRVAAAARARQEWIPARLRDPADPLVTWRSLAVGDLVELVLLDTRLTGRDCQAGDKGAKPLHDPSRSLLGDEQREWLRSRLLDTSRPWALVASGVVVNSMFLPLPSTVSFNPLLPNGYADFDGRLLHDDQWDGYPAEQERLSGWIAERARAGGRTVLVSGDVHSSWAFEGPCREDGPVAVELTVPAVSSAAMGRAHYPGAWRALDRAAKRMDHVRWADVTERGYVVLDVTPDEVRSEWWFVHPYHDRPAASAELAAAFVTRRADWPPRLDSSQDSVDDPWRPGLPDPLPARPDDLAALRRRRRLRIGAELAGAGAVVGVPIALGARRLRSRR
ncbi:MAG: alkaline phosphatase D family protein [Actinomycetota bacterium]|nr:alkaline phosphatase D family protein [Actinomycetota bacterium]